MKSKLIPLLIAISLIGNAASQVFGQPTDPNRPNVLYIMTDQQRFDALQFVQQELEQYNGKLKVRTPNLDKLASEGVYFRNAYTQCAVCAPARATLRTGLTLEGHGSQSNDLVKESTYLRSPQLFRDKIESAETIDQILVEDRGYVSEYFGKWHLPIDYAYSRDGSQQIIQYNHYDFATGQFLFRDPDSWGALYKEYLQYFDNQGDISKTFPEGTQSNTFSKYPYYPVQYDIRYGYPTNTPLTNPPFASTSQPHVMGEDVLTEQYTPTGMNGFIGLQSLGRLCQGTDPFFLTISFHNPHAPMVAAEKYFNYYFENRNEMAIPPSIADHSTNTGYGTGSRNDPEKVREWMACYYALVEEVDHWVGEMLDTLDYYPDVRDNTIVVFTSDHGEMLGAHGLNEKNKFLEESAHVPLFIKVPGAIEPGTVVEDDVTNLNLFSTILDYANAGANDNSHGTSLRNFVEDKSYNKDFDEGHIVTEWDFRTPNGTTLDRSLGGEVNFLSKKGDWKLMLTKKASSSKIDMLYDLSSDPYEVNNLVGNNGQTASDYVIGKAEHLKALLLDWMSRLDGIDGIYSDPYWNNNEGNGDMDEIRYRQTWRKVDLWVCDTIVQFGDPVNVEGTWTRNEWVYLGRTNSGNVEIQEVILEGADAQYFALSGFETGSIGERSFEKIRVQYLPDTPDFKLTDARLRIKNDAGEDRVIHLVNGALVESDLIIVDQCDSDAGWSGSNGVSLNEDGQQQGSGALEATGSETVGFEKVINPSVEMTWPLEDAQLRFWYYISDTALIGSQVSVQLGSGGAADSDVFSWSKTKSDLQTGWNLVAFPFSSAATTGNPDKMALNYFRLSAEKTGSLTTRLDFIHIKRGADPLPGAPSIIAPKLNAEGINVNTTLDWIPGDNSSSHEIYFGTTTPPPFIRSQSGNVFVVDNLESNTVYYWQIKEKNPTGITSGDIWNFKTIGPPSANYGGLPSNQSEGVSTTISVRWVAGAFSKRHNVYFGTSNPPPFIKTQVGNSYTPEGPLDFETTYYWRADAVNDVDTTIGEVYQFTTRAKDASGMVVLDDCDSKSGWGGSNFKNINNTEHRQGAACLYAEGSATNDFQRTFTPPVNTGIALEDAQLVFWYYISDVSQFSSKGQFELGSGGSPDVDEWNWQPDVSTLKDGWNLMQLDFSAAGSMGSPNLGAINWFRIYRIKNGPVETRIDYIRVVDKSVTPKPAGIAENPYPGHESTNVYTTPSLTWSPGEGAESHNIYFGEVDPPPFVKNQPGKMFYPGTLDSATVYYWRVDEVTLHDTTVGPVWNFKTVEDLVGYQDIIHNSNMTIAPNPSNGIVTLELDYYEDPVPIRVFDMGGRLVHRVVTEEKRTEINLSNLRNGAYILEAETNFNKSSTIIRIQ